MTYMELEDKETRLVRPVANVNHPNRVIGVGPIWVLFGRHTSKLSGHTQGSNVVHRVVCNDSLGTKLRTNQTF